MYICGVIQIKLETMPSMTDTNSGHGHRNPLSSRINIKLMNRLNAMFHKKATIGVLLLICTIISVTMASFPSTAWFDRMWDTEAGITIGGFSLEMSLRHWINDALMAIFFLTVGLEIKREMIAGQLSSVKKSALPIMAAIGGMAVPAIIYSIFNAGNPETAGGWGIPMATDIAFAIGIISLLGDRVPDGLKVFLTALAIVDDLGAIIVLALFYPSHALNFEWLIYAGLIMTLLLMFNRAKLASKWLYIIPGIFLWYCIYMSGIHATIAGVLLAMTIPSQGVTSKVKFQHKVSHFLEKFKKSSGENGLNMLSDTEQQQNVHGIWYETKQIDPLMHRFESKLHPFVNFLIIPIFALANAGVSLDFGEFAGNGIPAVSLGIFFGLLIGKPAGIFIMSFLGVKLKAAAMPEGITWSQVAAMGILGGIGFTMSIFINGLAFSSQELIDTGKISILLTSAIAAIAGLVALRLACRKTGDTGVSH